MIYIIKVVVFPKPNVLSGEIETWCNVHSKKHEIEFCYKLSEGMAKRLGGREKCYFYAQMDGSQLILGSEAQMQQW